MTQSQYYTNLFYQWDQRCRGWLKATLPVELEPPFIPFFRPKFKPQYLDEGKRHTWVSKFLDSFKEVKRQENDDEVFDYNIIEPFEYEQKNELRVIEVKIPKERKVLPEKMKALINSFSGSKSNISFEIIGNKDEITIQFVCDSSDWSYLKINIQAFFPEFTTISCDENLNNILIADLHTAVVDFGLFQESYRPIFTPKNFSIDPLSSICSILDSLVEEEQACIQILFKGVINDWSSNIVHSVTLNDGSSFFEDDNLAPKIAIEKTSSPLFAVTIKAIALSKNEHTTLSILEKMLSAIINSSNSTLNSFVPLSGNEDSFDEIIDDILLRQSHRLGMILNTDELNCFLHFPSESIFSKKLDKVIRKTVPVPSIALNKRFIIGQNSHLGKFEKVTYSIEDRLKHTHIIGATGTGKSTLISNLIHQDIAEGLGLVLFDPHGDLIDDVISNIPNERIDDVVLIDPSNQDYSVGLNILKVNSEIEKEVLSGDLVASFRKYATSWGDQMNTVFGNAILAILENPDGGSLHDLKRFLVENDFRNQFLAKVNDQQVLYYWQKEYPLLRTNSIGSILTRLDTFLRPKSIRNMVIQKKGLDFEELLGSNKIILLKLSQGLIGTENSFLLGSLLLSKIHQAILRRQQSSTRTPVFLYLDEFQNFITPSIKEMLSGVRKYNVGLVLSHQDLQQLQREDSELLNSVLGNVNTRIVFRVGEPDAKKLKEGFEHFSILDFQNLGKGETIFRIEQPKYDCSMDTFKPLYNNSDLEKSRKIIEITENSNKKYAIRKDEIESLFSNVSMGQSPQKNTQKIEKIVEEETAKETIKNDKPDIALNTPIITDFQPFKEESQKDIGVHRYLQTLVKKMAEQKGYVANIEMQVRNSTGQVDVLLSKNSSEIAIEISNTTDADWEMHNIKKCIDGNYKTIISLSGDPKQLERIKKKCESSIENFKLYDIHFFTPDAFFIYLDSLNITLNPIKENVMKGYRVNVSYDSSSKDDAELKRISIANVLLNSVKKRKK